jgi:hypothetical protein
MIEFPFFDFLILQKSELYYLESFDQQIEVVLKKHFLLCHDFLILGHENIKKTLLDQ